MQRVLFFGDSITDARRSREEEDWTGRGYVSLIAAKFGADCPGKYEFINRGIGGDRCVDLLSRIKIDCINLKPDYITIFAGVNDVLHEAAHKNGVSAEKSYQIFKLIVDEIKDVLPDSKIIMISPYVFYGCDTMYAWEFIKDGVKESAAIIKRIADEYKLPVIDMQSVFDETVKNSLVEYYIKDGVHPTLAGHEIISREWIKVFRDLN